MAEKEPRRSAATCAYLIHPTVPGRGLQQGLSPRKRDAAAGGFIVGPVAHSALNDLLDTLLVADQPQRLIGTGLRAAAAGLTPRSVHAPGPGMDGAVGTGANAVQQCECPARRESRTVAGRKAAIDRHQSACLLRVFSQPGAASTGEKHVGLCTVIAVSSK